MNLQAQQTRAETHLPLTAPLTLLQPSKLNPRKSFEKSSLIELANSLLEHGLLQPLVVRTHPEQEDHYEIVAGERRFRALSYLLEQGQIEANYPVPIILREVSDFDLVLLATVENIQRSDMTPLEEADAFVTLVELGENEEAIALKTGVAASTVKLRLKLATGISANVRRALEKGNLTLSQAQALTMVSKSLQNDLLPRVVDYGYGPKDIKRLITQDKVPVTRAFFALEAYTEAKGTIITDMFEPDNPGWFDSLELFIKLQNEAIQTKLTELKEQYSVVETSDTFYAFDYVEGDGAVIELNPYSYEVTLHERVIRRPASAQKLTTPSSEKRENRRRNEWEATTLTRAVHEKASEDFRLCLILNIMMLLSVKGFDIKLETGKPGKPSASNRIFSDTLQTAFTKFISDLNLDDTEAEEDKPYLPKVKPYNQNTFDLFEKLTAKADAELYQLFSQLTAVMISHGYDDTPWNTDIKKIVARETGLEPKDYFDASDLDYLKLHTKTELAELAEAVSISIDVTAMNKADAVAYLNKHKAIKAYLPNRLVLDVVEDKQDNFLKAA